MHERMKRIEAYARQVMDEMLQGDLGLAHNFAHVDRVRHWAVKIAQAEVLPIWRWWKRPLSCTMLAWLL